MRGSNLYILLKSISAALSFVLTLALRILDYNIILADYALVISAPLLIYGIIQLNTWKLIPLIGSRKLRYLRESYTIDVIVNLLVMVGALILVEVVLLTSANDISFDNYRFFFLIAIFDTSGTIEGYLRMQDKYNKLNIGVILGVIVKAFYFIAFLYNPSLITQILFYHFVAILLERGLNIFSYWRAGQSLIPVQFSREFLISNKITLWTLFVSSSGKAVMNRSDVYVLAMIFNKAVIADYFVGKQIARVVKLFADSIPKVIFPKLIVLNPTRLRVYNIKFRVSSLLVFILVTLTLQIIKWNITELMFPISLQSINTGILLIFTVFIGLMLLPEGTKLLRNNRMAIYRKLIYLQLAIFVIFLFVFRSSVFIIPLAILVSQLAWFLGYVYVNSAFRK